MLNLDYGHWKSLKDVDINNYIGFTYILKLSNGKKYIGAKKIWKVIKSPPSTYKRLPKNGFIESDWKTYSSSSKFVAEYINDGVTIDEYLIIGWYPSWGKTLMAEMELQLTNDVLRDPSWLNKQIGGRFNPACFDDFTEDDIARWMSYDKPNAHVSYPVMYKIGHKTKYVGPEKVDQYLKDGWQFGRSKDEKIVIVYSVSKYELYDNELEKNITVENQNKFALDNGLSSPHLSRLLRGEMDFVGKYSLLPEYRRKMHRYKDVETGKLFLTQVDLVEHFGLKRGSHNKLVKSGRVVELDVESREKYMERLKGINFIERVKYIDENKASERN